MLVRRFLHVYQDEGLFMLITFSYTSLIDQKISINARFVYEWMDEIK